MCEDPVHSDWIMVSSDTHQTQDLLVPDPAAGSELQAPGAREEGGPSFGPEKISQGPVNAITVLTLLDKLVNMLDTVQENQHKMEVRQAEMEGVVRGIQADMTKLSKSHSYTSNTVSKLLDKSRKVSVTMKEVRDKMERQGVQVRKLEANHGHLLKRDNFRVLIFQEENEIPSSVFVREPPPFPRDAEGESAPVDTNRSQEEGLHTIDLSSDEDVGLEADLEEEGEGLQDLEHMEKSRADKIKRSSLKKVDSLKKAFSKQNIEKKMNKIVSQEQREKIKKSLSAHKSSSFKVSPISFGMKKAKAGPDPQPADALAQARDSPSVEADIELSPLGSPDQELPFTEVHLQLAPAGLEEGKEETEEIPQSFGAEGEVSALSEGVSAEYALSATLPQGAPSPLPTFEDDEEKEEEKGEESEGDKEEGMAS
ncbi:caveolae-associated protein 2-like [Lampris incognitus]|uniref:caveolae-associated protein 2-like n=1 Tax=Lampris incognitus TaxID=2546036 RepID=UPI0024B5DAB5|nr:caveolae-associated protein 2-like [Lampris incognitus]